jgi:hypothetical protein
MAMAAFTISWLLTKRAMLFKTRVHFSLLLA